MGLSLTGMIGTIVLAILVINASLVAIWARELGRRLALALVIVPHFVVLTAGFAVSAYALSHLDRLVEQYRQSGAELEIPLSEFQPGSEAYETKLTEVVGRRKAELLAALSPGLAPCWKTPLAAHFILIPALFFILKRTRKPELSNDEGELSLPLRK